MLPFNEGKMLGKHVFDPKFTLASTELKKVLTKATGISFNVCLDMPCGNGRNIYLLASFFKSVTGYDVNQSHLENIRSLLPKYNGGNVILTEEVDLMEQTPAKISEADFICNIHYYNYSLLFRIIGEMKKGALLFVETPGCFGNNYLELPAEPEINYLFKDVTVLSYNPKLCKSVNSTGKNISFKALIRKDNE